MNPTINTPEMQAIQEYRAQSSLMFDLKELYALVNVCRLALANQGQDETDTTSAVLMLTATRLFDLCEQQEVREKALELAAYPHLAEEVQS
ncbi:MAG: hypothetical protein BWK73_36075 [Thiothrix lacustris]|uniref:Uncharacterized protein n=1 Tax=Thiothrix lacustris TaxID=525917 RepID=A0A1Y1QFR5_9GAMM|nr:MAG: hypothetical protein BWK73_36075 [Thiothrix lacustris]